MQQGAFSEKDDSLRALLVKLDAVDSETGTGSLTSEDITLIRRQLAESQTLVRETIERLRQSQEENEMITRRRDEVESRLAALEAEYEELLEKTINDEETSNVDVAESMAELKVLAKPVIDIYPTHCSSQNKLEAQYAAKRDAHQGEVADLKQQLDMRATEIRNLNSSIDGLKGVNEELKVGFTALPYTNMLFN